MNRISEYRNMPPRPWYLPPRVEPVTMEVAREIQRNQTMAEWPWKARLLAKLTKPEDRGLGDVVERLAGGSGRLWKVWYKRIVGRSCGCDDHKSMLNRMYPLK